MDFANPYRPGAGHRPPYLAGRAKEQDEFRKLLRQEVILKNLVLTGLRGVGKTVLLETFKPLAQASGWRWVGTGFLESTSMTEAALATRLITDLSVVTAPVVISKQEVAGIGFRPATTSHALRLDYETLRSTYEQTPGLVDDKLTSSTRLAWGVLERAGASGLDPACEPPRRSATATPIGCSWPSQSPDSSTRIATENTCSPSRSWAPSSAVRPAERSSDASPCAHVGPPRSFAGALSSVTVRHG